MLTDLKIKNLKPRAKQIKVAERDGLYVTITPAGVASFRYDYRINGRRETLTLGRYDESRRRDSYLPGRDVVSRKVNRPRKGRLKRRTELARR